MGFSAVSGCREPHGLKPWGRRHVKHAHGPLLCHGPARTKKLTTHLEIRVFHDTPEVLDD